MHGWLDTYRHLFDTQLARTPESIRLAQRLRYVAYCERKEFLDKSAYPAGLEFDEDDARSLHALLVFRPTGAPMGSVRLILPPNPFPVERVASDFRLTRKEVTQRRQVAEISRLCTTWRYLPESREGLGKLAERERRRMLTCAILGLFRGVVALSQEAGVRYWCGMMSPSVLRGARRLGVHFEERGAPVWCFGHKQPVFGSAAQVLETMRRLQPHFWAVVTAPLGSASSHEAYSFEQDSWEPVGAESGPFEAYEEPVEVGRDEPHLHGDES